MLPKPGDTCENAADACSPGLYCGFYDQKCHAAGAVGDSCEEFPCQAGLACGQSLQCVVKKPFGQTCAIDDECADATCKSGTCSGCPCPENMYCDLGGSCAPDFQDSTHACYSDDMCAKTHFCGAGMECLKRPNLGQTCAEWQLNGSGTQRSCAEGLHCRNKASCNFAPTPAGADCVCDADLIANAGERCETRTCSSNLLCVASQLDGVCSSAP
jgi:hypothetical protein